MGILVISAFRNVLKSDRIRIFQILIFVSTAVPGVCPK